MRRRTLLSFVVALLVVLAGQLSAHPLGNFSISQYAAIQIGEREIELRYIIDMAEIPTFQEIQDSGFVTHASDPSAKAYAARQAEKLGAGLSLEVNGRPVSLRAESQEVIFPEGAGGLPTLKLAVVYKGKFIGGAALALNYRDNNFPGRAGWKEVIAVARPGVKLIDSNVPSSDRSAALSDYPTDLLDSPPQRLTAQLRFDLIAAQGLPAGVVTDVPVLVPTSTDSAVNRGVLAATIPVKTQDIPAPILLEASDAVAAVPQEPTSPLTANRQATPRSSFTELMGRKELSLGIILTALAIAVGLGAFHALEPGHGKTLVAAYLVGSRGTFKHALLLGLIVTASHTAGVYLLGAVTLYASKYIVPENLYPWLGALSGVLIALLGLTLLVRRYRGQDGLFAHAQHHHGDHEHDHGPHSHHYHHDHQHSQVHSHDHHGHGHHNHDAANAVSWKQLLTLGISGGMVPCPGALVVLLSAVAMQRIGFGLLLIVAFSVGLAAVLIAVGMLMVYARSFMARWHADGPLVGRWLPLTSSAMIVVIGLALTFQALKGTGLFSTV